MQKSKLVFLAGAASVTMSIMLLSSCGKKYETTNINPVVGAVSPGAADGDYAYEQTLAEKIFDDAEAIADRAYAAGEADTGAFKTSGCAITVFSPGFLSIEFGAENCLTAEGVNRKGRIEVHYTGGYWDSGTVRTITFSSYYHNNVKVEGAKTVTVMGYNKYNERFTSAHVEATLIKDDNSTIAVNWDRQRTLAGGSWTPTTIWDDIYRLTGSGNITRSGGTVHVDIIRPLEIHNNCRWIEKGMIGFTLNTGESRTLNYGDAAYCDNDAILMGPDGASNILKLP
ncbi:MAG: hypothetical protein KF744_16405 [Taibaiella sp.]|nr:hypothetical protein [Taibaiella sp.]